MHRINIFVTRLTQQRAAHLTLTVLATRTVCTPIASHTKLHAVLHRKRCLRKTQPSERKRGGCLKNKAIYSGAAGFLETELSAQVPQFLSFSISQFRVLPETARENLEHLIYFSKRVDGPRT